MRANSNQNIKSYKVVSTNKTSSACEVPDASVADNRMLQQIGSSKQLVSYEGIVTGTNESASGIYILDKKFTLVLTHLCLLSNIPTFEKGQKIKVINCHFETYNESFKILWACGRTTVAKVAYEASEPEFNCSESQRIYDKDEYTKQKTDPILYLCHDWNLNVSEVLSLSDIYRMHYCMKFKNDNKEHNLNQVNCFVSFLKNCGVSNISNSKTRCLITEFLSMPHECGSLMLKEKSRSLLSRIHEVRCSLITIAEFKDVLMNQMVKRKEILNIKQAKVSNYNYFEVPEINVMSEITSRFRDKLTYILEDQANVSKSSLNLIGVLDIDTRSG